MAYTALPATAWEDRKRQPFCTYALAIDIDSPKIGCFKPQQTTRSQSRFDMPRMVENLTYLPFCAASGTLFQTSVQNEKRQETEGHISQCIIHKNRDLPSGTSRRPTLP